MDYLPLKDRASAGFSALEAAVAGAMMLVVIGSAVMTTISFTDSTKAGRRNVLAIGNTSRANRGVASELMNANILDPFEDLKIYTEAHIQVPDQDSEGEPIVAVGPVLCLTKNTDYRLENGEVKYDRLKIEYRMDTQEDMNNDGFTDQLLRIVDPDGPDPMYQVLACKVISVSFRKHGAVVRITSTTRGGMNGITEVEGVRYKEYNQITQSQVARPRNF